MNRLKGWLQSLVLAAFFLPYILPVSVVFRIWNWMFDKDYGIAQIRRRRSSTAASTSRSSARSPCSCRRSRSSPSGGCSASTSCCSSPGLRNISSEIYEAAALDGAGRWAQFRRITWPLIWPVTVLVLTIQLILQFKIFDQVYLFSAGGRADPTMVMVQYIYKQAFQMNQGGLAAAASVVLFVHHRGVLGAAVPVAAGEGRAMSASAQIDAHDGAHRGRNAAFAASAISISSVSSSRWRP